MIYNYHTHTYRCGHATGTDEEYIERAIQCNVKYMGFSDHIPLMCDDGYESDFRIPMAQAKSYVEDLSKLKEKYDYYGISEDIYYDTLSDIKIWCDKNNNKGLLNYRWIKNHVSFQLFRLGRLQFQFSLKYRL